MTLMHVWVTFEIETKKLVRISLLGYINTCQVGILLHVDTKCCIQHDTSQTHWWNVQNFKAVLRSYWWKCVYRSESLMEKYWYIGHFFELKVRILKYIHMYCYKPPHQMRKYHQQCQRCLFANAGKTNVAAKWRIMDIQPKWDTGLDTLLG